MNILRIVIFGFTISIILMTSLILVDTDSNASDQDLNSHTQQIRLGESLSILSNRLYGTYDYWHSIAKLNRKKIPNPNVVQAGAVLRVPYMKNLKVKTVPSNKDLAESNSEDFTTESQLLVKKEPFKRTLSSTSMSGQFEKSTIDELILIPHAKRNKLEHELRKSKMLWGQ